MGVIHKFSGQPGLFDWQDIEIQSYAGDSAGHVTKRELIGRDDGARNFEVRYFEVAPGGHTALDQHAHDHGVIVIQGRAELLLGEDMRQVHYGDVIYIAPYEKHQFRNESDKPFGFLCVIPPKT